MKTIRTSIALLGLCLTAVAQVQQRNVDLTNSTMVIPFPVTDIFPGTCRPGQVFTNLLGTWGANVYICDEAKTWHVLGGGGSGSTTTNGTNGQALTSDGAGGFGTPVTLAASAITNALNASNISSGNLAAARLPSSGGFAYNDTSKNAAVVGTISTGQTGTGTGAVNIIGGTSGSATLTVGAAAGTPTLTLPTTSGTLARTADNVATATALAANGTNCSAGNYPLGVDAAGNAEGCTAATGGSTYTGTANQVTVTGTVLSLPTVLNPPGSVTAVGVVAGSNISTSGVLPAGTALVSGGALGTPSSGSAANLSSFPTLNQSTTGNAGTATALAANGTNCSAGNYPLGVDASGNAEGCTSAAGGGTAAAYATTTFSATPVFAITSNTVNGFTLTLTGDVTSSTITGPTAGQVIGMNICQDATGSRAFVWPTSFVGAGAISAAGSSCTNQSFQYDGASYQARGAAYSTGTTGGSITLPGSSSGTTVLQPTAAASGTLTLPAATDTLVGKSTTDTLTNKSISGGQITSAVATSTALAANGANCSAGSYPLGVDASGAVETCTPVLTFATPAASHTLVGNADIFVCTTTCTITVPVPVAGAQYCVMNDDNVSTVITLSAIGSSARYENTARTAYGTAGTGTFVSGGASKDMVCLVGRDSTHYLTASSNGTWVAN